MSGDYQLDVLTLRAEKAAAIPTQILNEIDQLEDEISDLRAQLETALQRHEDAEADARDADDNLAEYQHLNRVYDEAFGGES